MLSGFTPANNKIQAKLYVISSSSHKRDGHAQAQEVSVKMTGKLQHFFW